MKSSLRLLILVTICVLLSSLVVGGVYAVYVTSASKTIVISASVSEFTPVNGEYYLVGSFCDWSVNENAVLLNDALSDGNTAQKSGITLNQGDTCKVVQYGDDIVWFGWSSSTFMQGDNFLAQADGNYGVYLNGGVCTVAIQPDSSFVPTVGAYYLIGTFSGWQINSFAIPFNDACANGDLATELNISLVQYSQCRIVKKTSGGMDWIAWSGVSVVGDNYQVPAAGLYNVYVNMYNNGWIGAAA